MDEPVALWAAAIVRLGQARDNPELKAKEPELYKRIENLIEDSFAGPSNLISDIGFKTQVAYAITDVDRVLPEPIALPTELRAEVTRLAATAPGLSHADSFGDMQDLMARASNLGGSDIALLQEIREQARLYPQGNHNWERVDDLERRLRERLANPAASEPPPSAPLQQPSEPVQTDMRSNAPQQPSAPSDRPQEPQQVGQATVQMSRAGAIMNAVAPGQPAGQAPWTGAQQALGNRLANWEQNRASRHLEAMVDKAESSATIAVRAIEKLENGPAAGVLRKIKLEAANDPSGFSGVIADMRPGGKYEGLRNAFAEILTNDKGVALSHGDAKAALTTHLMDRDALVKEYRKRGLDPDEVEAKFEGTDRALASSGRIPGKEAGKSLSEELSERAKQMAHDLIERVHAVVARVQTAMAPSQGPAPLPSF